MKRWMICLILALALSACAGNTNSENRRSDLQAQTPGTPSLDAPPTPILPPELSGDVEIQQLMLHSSERWQTLQATYTITEYPLPGTNGELQVSSSQFWIRQPAEFKVVIGAPAGGAVTTLICDGKTILENDENRSELPPSAAAPFIPPETLSDTVFPHPLTGLLGTPVSDLIFPAGLAQRGGEYRLTGQESVASRLAYVVEWGREPGVLIDRLWVDGETGVILRQQNYARENSISPISEIEATYIVYDKEFADAMFDVGVAPTPTPTAEVAASDTLSVTVTILPEALNVRHGPNTGYTVIATLPTGTVLTVIGRTENSDWWKVKLPDGQTGWVWSAFVELNGDEEDVPVTNY